MAAATWRSPRSGAAHAFVELDVTDVEPWCRARAGLGLVHVVGAALARAIAAVPDANARVAFGRIRPRRDIGISYIIGIDRGGDMSAVCVRGADGKSPREVAREVVRGARAARRGADPQFERAMRLVDVVPRRLIRPGIALTGLVTSALGWPIRPLGIAAEPFGSALVSSVDAWGLERVLPPLIPFARLGLIAVLGAPSPRPRVRDGEIVVRRIAEVGLTLDHRLLDGAQAGRLVAELRAAAEHPWIAWPEPGSAPG